MLKKAGFVVAAATAGLLAVSPLAFAGPADSFIDNSTNPSLVGLQDMNPEAALPIAACGNDIPVNVLGVQVPDSNVDLGSALGVLEPASVERGDGAGDRSECTPGAFTG